MIYQKQKVIKLSELIIPKYYLNFNDIEHTHQIYTSGRAGTKSSRGALRAVRRIVDKKDGSVVIMRKFHNKLKKTVFNECKRAISRLCIPKNKFKITVSPMQITYLPTGNTIYFTGNDSIDDTKGMIDENKPIVLVELDELTEFFDKGDGEDELQNIEATFVRGNDDEFVMEYYFNPPKNPKAPIMEWVDKMVKRPDCIRIHTDYRDVPQSWLGKKLIDTAEILKSLDEKMYKWIWLGLCVGIDEVIYYMFDESIHVKEPTKSQLEQISNLYIGVDYGQMNATTYQCFGLDLIDKCIRGIDEYYYSGRDKGKQKSPSEYAHDFKEFVEKIERQTNKRVVAVYIDPSAKGLAEEIRRVCPSIKIKDANNDVKLGISRVQKLMTFKCLFLSPKQKNLIAERYQYKYNENLLDKGREEPVKENDHGSDAERYLAMGLWKYLKRVLPALDILDDKGGDDSDRKNN